MPKSFWLSIAATAVLAISLAAAAMTLGAAPPSGGSDPYTTVWVTDPDTAYSIMLTYGDNACYDDQRHGGKGGFTSGWVCVVPKGWRKEVE